MMAWKKLGRILNPDDCQVDWFDSHAALPVAEKLDSGLTRVYFSGRDRAGRANIGYFELDINSPHNILRISPGPVLPLGSLGTFDDHGLTMSCLASHRGKTYLYYTGWALGVTVPFYFYIGLGVSVQGGTAFKKQSEAPVMERHPVDPYLTASPFILIENDVWRAWYVSCTKWEIVDGEPKHYYHIKYTESDDGIHWRRDGHVAIDFASPDEYAFSRPCVIKDADTYKMWYAYRGESYRIGYAESPDGLVWVRKDDQVGIDVSETGWDSEMVDYPFVFDHQGSRYMLYNGNGYGKTGIGLAVWSESP